MSRDYDFDADFVLEEPAQTPLEEEWEKRRAFAKGASPRNYDDSLAAFRFVQDAADEIARLRSRVEEAERERDALRGALEEIASIAASALSSPPYKSTPYLHAIDHAARRALAPTSGGTADE